LAFKSIHSALYTYFDAYAGYPGSLHPDGNRVDRSITQGTTNLDNLATIGFYINKLRFDQKFIVGISFGFNKSDQEIAHMLNYALKVKNYDSKATRKLRNKTVRELDEKFREIGLIEGKDVF